MNKSRRVLFSIVFMMVVVCTLCLSGGSKLTARAAGGGSADQYQRPEAGTIMKDYKNGTNYGKHPRLMLNADRVNELKGILSGKKTSDPRYELEKAVLNRADSLKKGLDSSFELKYEKSGRLLGPNRSGTAADFLFDRMTVFGMAYQLTGDKSYTEAAWKILNKTNQFQDFNPSDDLDFAFFCQSYAIAYDWMYTAWSDEQRAKLQNVIYEKCIKVAQKAYKSTGVVTGFWVDHNHNALVNSGVVMVSLAVMDKYPNEAPTLCQNDFVSLEKLLNKGLISEGYEYTLLSMDNLSLMFASLETTTGTLYGLDQCKSLAGARPLLAVYGLESDCGSFGIGDAYSNFITNAGELYFDIHYKVNASYQKEMVLKRIKAATDGAPKVKALLYYKAETGKSGSVGKDYVCDDHGVTFASFRTGFQSGQSYVGIKAGTTASEFFRHMDEGSFVFHSQGVKWATDLGKDNYGISGYMTPHKNHDRWKIFRLRPDGHNTLLINPNPNDFGYEFDKTATITTKTTDKEAMAVVNMSDLVSTKANSAKRGFLLTDNRLSLVVRDEVDLKKSSDLYWIMYTEQNVSVSGNTATLTCGDKKVKLDFASSVKGSLYVDKNAAPWSLAPTVNGQNQNTAYKRIVFKITGAQGKVNITAKFTPVTEAAKNAPGVTTYGNISSWKLSEQKEDTTKKSVTDVFKDVHKGMWYVDAIQYVYDRKIMVGKSKDRFGTEDKLTRGQFVTVLYNMTDDKKIKASIPFDDVDPKSYYYDAVRWAYERKIVDGVSATKFSPDAEITREQTVKMLYNYGQKYGCSTRINDNILSNYKDGKQVSKWAQTSMKWALTNNVISGKGTGSSKILDPKGSAVRAECAQIIANYFKNGLK